jgi:hypothetical protein
MPSPTSRRNAPRPWNAHSANPAGIWHPLQTNLRQVAVQAAAFAAAAGMSEEAWVVGVLHDLGKYGSHFQKRLGGGGGAQD